MNGLGRSTVGKGAVQRALGLAALATHGPMTVGLDDVQRSGAHGMMDLLVTVLVAGSGLARLVNAQSRTRPLPAAAAPGAPGKTTRAAAKGTEITRLDRHHVTPIAGEGAASAWIPAAYGLDSARRTDLLLYGDAHLVARRNLSAAAMLAAHDADGTEHGRVRG